MTKNAFLATIQKQLLLLTYNLPLFLLLILNFPKPQLSNTSLVFSVDASGQRIEAISLQD